MDTSYFLGCCMGLSPAGRVACFVAAVALLSLPQIHILLNSPCAWGGHIGDSFSGGPRLRGGYSLSTLLPLSLLSALPGYPCSCSWWSHCSFDHGGPSLVVDFFRPFTVAVQLCCGRCWCCGAISPPCPPKGLLLSFQGRGTFLALIVWCLWVSSLSSDQWMMPSDH